MQQDDPARYWHPIKDLWSDTFQRRQSNPWTTSRQPQAVSLATSNSSRAVTEYVRCDEGIRFWAEQPFRELYVLLSDLSPADRLRLAGSCASSVDYAAEITAASVSPTPPAAGRRE